MSDSQPNLVLDLLRAMRGDLSEIKTDLTELKQRVGLLAAQYANLSNRIDRIAGDVSLIKRRLDLVEA
jgi:predicted nuclease with TOPRIM domain